MLRPSGGLERAYAHCGGVERLPDEGLQGVRHLCFMFSLTRYGADACLR